METLILEATIAEKQYKVNLAKPIDISIPIKPGGVRAFCSDDVKIEPVILENFIGDISKGGSVNFRNICFNPHGNVTHTECVGHIHANWQKVNDIKISFLLLAKLITVEPTILSNGDLVISKSTIEKQVSLNENTQAVVIRTLPNTNSKLIKNYSGTNPPYFDTSAIDYLAGLGVEHLLTDLPSIDREEDEGKLICHKVWWDTIGESRSHCTITELVFVPNEIKDNQYLLNLSVANVASDASPSRPLLFEIIKS